MKAFDTLLAKKWFIIGAFLIVMVLTIIFIGDSAPDLYSATSSIYAASGESYRDSMEGISIMRAYLVLIKSRKVAERASSYLAYEVSTDSIMSAVSSNSETNSNIISITAVSTDPTQAVAMANAVADAFIQELVSVAAVESVRVLDPAFRAAKSVDSTREAMKSRLMITAATVVLLVGYIATTAAFDTRVAYPYEVTLDGKLKLLGVIPGKDI